MNTITDLLKRRKKPTVSVSVTIAEADRDRLDSLCDAHGVRRSEVLQAAILAAVEELETALQAKGER